MNKRLVSHWVFLCLSILAARLSLARPGTALVSMPQSAEEQDVSQDWILEGVVVAENPAHSLALVRHAGATRARTLRIGEEYRGKVLVDVARDSVVLRTSEGTERVFLSRDAAVEAGSHPGAARSGDRDDWVRREFSRARADDRLDKEMPVILRDTAIAPLVRDGEVRGLQLTRLPDGTLLSEAGLLPGDVILSIDGAPLRGLDSLWAVLSRLRGKDEIRVVLERHGERMHLAYAIIP